MNRRSRARKALALVSLIPNDTFDIWRGLARYWVVILNINYVFVENSQLVGPGFA